MGIYNIIENSYNFNDFDKLKFLLPHSYAKTESDKLSSYFLGGNYRYLQKQTVLEVSSKLYADENNVGSFTSSNLYYLAKKVYERSRLKIDEEYLFNKATLCRVDVKKDIFVGKYHCGDKIASVRELALVYSVNPNTIQKALSELERTGIIYSKRAQGRYVSEDSNLIDDLKKEVSDQKIRTFLNEMMEIGYDKSMIIKITIVIILIFFNFFIFVITNYTMCI